MGKNVARQIVIPIDMDRMEKMHQEAITKVASKLSMEDIESITLQCESIIDNIPLVVHYLDVATSMTNTLKKYYNQVGSPNHFHHYVKGIDPDQYGKAQTFMKQIKSLRRMIGEVLVQKLKMDN